MLARFEPPRAAAFGPAGVDDARWIHLGIEASKLAMADRDALLADPAMADDPTEWLLSDEHLRTLAGRIDDATRRAGAGGRSFRAAAARSTSRSSTATGTRSA